MVLISNQAAAQFYLTKTTKMYLPSDFRNNLLDHMK